GGWWARSIAPTSSAGWSSTQADSRRADGRGHLRQIAPRSSLAEGLDSVAARHSRQDVHVQVEDVLPCGGAVIPADVKRVRLERFGNLAHHGLHRLEQLIHGSVVELRQRRRV